MKLSCCWIWLTRKAILCAHLRRPVPRNPMRPGTIGNREKPRRLDRLDHEDRNRVVHNWAHRFRSHLMSWQRGMTAPACRPPAQDDAKVTLSERYMHEFSAAAWFSHPRLKVPGLLSLLPDVDNTDRSGSRSGAGNATTAETKRFTIVFKPEAQAMIRNR